MESFSGAALQIQIQEVFELYATSIQSFSLGIHSFLCNCEDHLERLDRHLTSEGCNTLSMEKTSGKAQCAPYYKNTIRCSISVIIVPTFNVTPNNFYVEYTHSERCTLEDLYSYFYYYILIAIILNTIIIIAFITIIIPSFLLLFLLLLLLVLVVVE